MAEARKYLDYDGLVDVLQRVKEMYTSVSTISFRGICATISELPDVSSLKPGYMYSVTTGGLTTDDFVVGPGQVLQDGENVVAVNIGDDEEPIMKWDIVGGVFNIEDRLQFGNYMPASPSTGDTFLYLGSTTYVYLEVTPSGDENPSEKGWYEYSVADDEYKLSEDISVVEGKTYYVKKEQYKTGVIYVYTSIGVWEPKPSGDKISSIDVSDINALFE